MHPNAHNALLSECVKLGANTMRTAVCVTRMPGEHTIASSASPVAPVIFAWACTCQTIKHGAHNALPLRSKSNPKIVGPFNSSFALSGNQKRAHTIVGFRSQGRLIGEARLFAPTVNLPLS